METVAKLKNSPHSPRKMRLLADLIRGMKVDRALFVLKVHEKHVYAQQLEKLLRSAISNWEQKHQGESMEDSGLFIKIINVDGGRMLKRIQPAPQGRAHRIRKRYNHITLIVDSENTVVENNTAE